LTLALRNRTEQNEKKLVLTQRKVIQNQYQKLNDCAANVFESKALAE
jgi:hypothetical protein